MRDKVINLITFFFDHEYYPRFADIICILWISLSHVYYPYFVDIPVFHGYYQHSVDIVDISACCGY